jgi:hypothetical protein
MKRADINVFSHKKSFPYVSPSLGATFTPSEINANMV